MSEKRRDHKGRILRNGESQRKDGKYEYKYIDANGVRHSAYSWKLVETDKVPEGRRCTEALRDMEKRINRDIEDGINIFDAERVTLNEYYTAYISEKKELKQSTRTNYQFMYRRYIQDVIGNRPIASIKYSDIRKFYLTFIHDKGFKPNSMEVIHTLLHPVFSMAVRDGMIRTNPTDGVMAEIKKSHDWEKPKRHALTEPQQKAFIEYITNHAVYGHWLPIFTVFLGTGCRVGELTGLRWDDCDFENNIITIDHNLIYRQQDSGRCEFHVTTPKTKAGIRIIPMLVPVKEALLQIKNEQGKKDFIPPVVDGYTNFIFLNRYNNVFGAHEFNRAIFRILRDYNKAESALAERDERPPVLIPHFTVHSLRHTFCTRFCENETNLKVIQEIMGHADISTTMDIYNEATREKKMEVFANLEGKIRIC
jgi:integrase